ncbi:MAG TPA: MauE/DoxX family redox-associated membrane protein [Steroidobacteraceae bacterium]|nr:MauE/DoxX family redox-associated membrane protein [Steroidobacteraceae bacterium]
MYPLDPVVRAIIFSGFALLFAFAGSHKLAARAEFAATLADYRVLPASLESAASFLIPGLEGLIAAGLLIRRVGGPASLAGVALLLAYAAAIGLNLLRGRRQLECGCLGPHSSSVVSAGLVWRNMLMALALVTAWVIKWSTRPMGWLDVGTVLFALCGLALVYLAANGLLAIAARRLPQRG